MNRPIGLSDVLWDAVVNDHLSIQGAEQAVRIRERQIAAHIIQVATKEGWDAEVVQKMLTQCGLFERGES